MFKVPIDRRRPAVPSGPFRQPLVESATACWPARLPLRTKRLDVIDYVSRARTACLSRCWHGLSRRKAYRAAELR